MSTKRGNGAQSGAFPISAHSGSGADSVAPVLSSAPLASLEGGRAALPTQEFTQAVLNEQSDDALNERNPNSLLVATPQKQQPPRSVKKQAPSSSATKSSSKPAKPASQDVIASAVATAVRGGLTTFRVSPKAQVALNASSPQVQAAHAALQAISSQKLFPIFSPRQHEPNLLPDTSSLLSTTRSHEQAFHESQAAEIRPSLTLPPSTMTATPLSISALPPASSTSPAHMHQPQHLMSAIRPPLSHRQIAGQTQSCPQATPQRDEPEHHAPFSDLGEMPLHTSAAARLQHDIAQAVAQSATMHPNPVSQPVSFRNNPAQLTHWRQLFSDLSNRRHNLNSAEELHLHLVSELLTMHQESVERSRALDRTHMGQAALLLDGLRPGTTASQPIVIPSQSPAVTLAAPATRTPDDSPTNRLASHPPLRTATRQHETLPGSTQTQQTARTWMAPAQEAGQHADRVKQEHLHQERQLYKAEQSLLAEDAQDKAILKATELRIRRRQKALQHIKAQTHMPHIGDSRATASAHTAPKLKIRVRAPAVSRTQELRIASLTGDTELLSHGSDRVKSEERSEDERTEILRELDPAAAARHLFFPKRNVKFTDKQGYILNSFVRADNDEVNMPEERSVSRSTDHPSDCDTSFSSHVTDDDPSSDYVPNSQSPPSRRSISAQEWAEYQALKRAQTHAQGHQQPRGLPTYNISIAEPPEHGDWRDINHLTTVFKDKHVKYVNRCGNGEHMSVWECYTQTARDCIIEHLNAVSTNPAITFDADFMSSLLDAELYALLQDNLGISYDVDAEAALRAITFQGSILDIPSWVVYRTAWAQVLQRVTTAGTVQPRRLTELFRNGIPDEFMRTWLHSRKHNSWTDAYTAAIGALKDPKWQSSYNKHILATAATRTQADPKLKSHSTPQHSQSPHQHQHQAQTSRIRTQSPRPSDKTCFTRSASCFRPTQIPNSQRRFQC
jgi:hypothetical protein